MMQYQGRTDNCAIQKIFGKLILPYQAVAVPEIVPSALWLWLWLRYNTNKLINWWLIAYGGREAVTAGLPVPSWFPRTFEHARGHRVKTSSFLYLFWYVFFFLGVHRFLSMEIVMFYGTCESFWDASWRICLIQVAVFIWGAAVCRNRNEDLKYIRACRIFSSQDDFCTIL